MNAYYAIDQDHEATINEAERIATVAAYHLDVFRADPPDRCASMCAWKDPWGACTRWQRWPACDLHQFLVEEKIIDAEA